MEPLNGGPALGPNKIPARKRKPGPEFLTALNLLADSYVVATSNKTLIEPPKSSAAPVKVEVNQG